MSLERTESQTVMWEFPSRVVGQKFRLLLYWQLTIDLSRVPSEKSICLRENTLLA